MLIIVLTSITLYEALSEEGWERRALRKAEKEYWEYMDKMYGRGRFSILSDHMRR